jgi:hypothetical protein
MLALLKKKPSIFKMFLFLILFLTLIFAFCLFLLKDYNTINNKAESYLLVDSIKKIFSEYDAFATIITDMNNNNYSKEEELKILLSNYHFTINPDALYILQLWNGRVVSKNDVTLKNPLLLQNIEDHISNIKDSGTKYLFDGDLIYILYPLPTTKQNVNKTFLVVIMDRENIYKIFPFKFTLSLPNDSDDSYVIKDNLFLQTHYQPIDLFLFAKNLSLASLISFFLLCILIVSIVLNYTLTKLINAQQVRSLASMQEVNQSLEDHTYLIIEANKKLSSFYNKIFGQYLTTPELLEKILINQRPKELNATEIMNLISECRDIITPILLESKITLELNSFEDFEPIQVDFFIMKLVILNLLTKICLRMPISKGIINLYISSNPDQIIIRFTDNGFITDATAKIVNLKTGALYLPANDFKKLLSSIHATIEELHSQSNVTTLILANKLKDGKVFLNNNIIRFPNPNA